VPCTRINLFSEQYNLPDDVLVGFPEFEIIQEAGRRASSAREEVSGSLELYAIALCRTAVTVRRLSSSSPDQARIS